MMLNGGEVKPSLDELAHFGVKGMKWGQRHADEPTHSSYTQRKQSNDRQQHGKRAVARINSRLNKGISREEALRLESIRNARQRLAVIGAVIAANIILDQGSVSTAGIRSYVSNRANENRAAAKVTKSVIGIGSKAAKTPFVKAHRGVHNITTLK